MKINQVKYNIEGKINTSIVLISDIHYYSKKNLKVFEKIYNEIKKIKNDYICITGDLIDYSNITNQDILINWLEKLSNLSKVIISIGNHEYYNTNSKNQSLNYDLMDKIRNIDNVYLLNNENIIIDNINFYGLNIPLELYKYEIKENIKISNYINNLNIKTYKTKYNILLCHSPRFITNNINKIKYKFDLVLCGHMHGGLTPQILRKYFKNTVLISPEKKLFVKNAYGLIKCNDSNIIITSGVTKLSKKTKLNKFDNLFVKEVVAIKIHN